MSNDLEKYWKKVTNCLIKSHGMSEGDAIMLAIRVQNSFEHPEDGFPPSALIYDYEPSDLAAELCNGAQ